MGRFWKAFNEGLGLPAKIVGAVSAGAVIVGWIPAVRHWLDSHAEYVSTFWFVELTGVGAVALWLATRDIGRGITNDRRRKDVWHRYANGFDYVAREMLPDGPPVRFLLPALPGFNPDWIPVLTATCSVCPDHPALVGSQSPDGTGPGLCCHECRTTYSTKQPGEVEADALRALRRAIGAPT